MDRRDRRREKSANYTRNEKHLLLDSVLPYLNVIENKKTDSMTIDIKVRAWNAVGARYNAVNAKAQRRVSQLKTLYENIKKRTKKDIIAYQAEFMKSSEGKSPPKRIDDVSWRLIKTVPTLKTLWKNTILTKQDLAKDKGDPLTLDDAESSALQDQSPVAEDFVDVKHEIIHNQDNFIETIGEINNELNEVCEVPHFHNYAITTNENVEEASSTVDINSSHRNNPRHATLCSIEMEVNKRELEKLDLDIQMKKLEVELMKGKLREQEMNLKFKELEYEIKRSEFEKQLNDKATN
ncbi:hypothetical protein AMK59_1403 [Oryctes borbonicus]|uniref:Regulatory protein zeste n=1 Tax=Oryctes borbonicus TaxID=1629725 RepID=A0A0T6BBT5_9SCAR|nr:hypothetical protein AMK59_1403 [Oryctes borbonicus]